MMEAKLTEIFKELCKVNDMIMQQSDNVVPMVFIIEKDYGMRAIACPFKDGRDKDKIRAVIMKLIANSELKAYVCLLDAHMTKMDLKTNKPSGVQEIMMRTLYTKDEVVRDWVIHEGTKVVEKFDTKFMETPDAKWGDQWNFWNTGEPTTPEQDRIYQEYKKNNPKLYK